MKPFEDVDSGFYAEAKRELEAIREERRKRFRILVCLDGTEESYEGVKIAKEIGASEDCDIILLYVRTFDQGLRSGGLQMRVARQNMLEWDLDLPGIQYLKLGRNMLIGADEQRNEWQTISSHKAIRGDPLGARTERERLLTPLRLPEESGELGERRDQPQLALARVLGLLRAFGRPQIPRAYLVDSHGCWRESTSGILRRRAGVTSFLPLW